MPRYAITSALVLLGCALACSQAVAGGALDAAVTLKDVEKFKRLSGEIRITPELRKKTWEWDADRTRKRVFSRAPVIECPFLYPRPKLDGSIGEGEWGQEEGWGNYKAEIAGPPEFRMGYDDHYLYLAWRTMNAGPLKNGGDDFRRYFKTGGAVDIKLATDPDADPKRRRPTKGDLRLLITVADDKPVAVLYRPVAPGAPKTHAWQTSTPAAGTTAFDQVVKIKGVRIAVSSGESSNYGVEAAVPLEALGLKIKKGLVLKID